VAYSNDEYASDEQRCATTPVRPAPTGEAVGLRRQPVIFGVTPPRRTAPAGTPSSSFLEFDRLARATRFARMWEAGSNKNAAPNLDAA